MKNNYHTTGNNASYEFIQNKYNNKCEEISGELWMTRGRVCNKQFKSTKDFQ